MPGIYLLTCEQAVGFTYLGVEKALFCLYFDSSYTVKRYIVSIWKTILHLSPLPLFLISFDHLLNVLMRLMRNLIFI